MSSHRKRKQAAAKFFIENERPEEIVQDPLVYYTKNRVMEYVNSKSLMRIQEKIAHRVMQIADMEAPARVLDLGMGSGFSTCYFFLQKYQPVGIDINRLFLTSYPIDELNPIHADIRMLGFRPQSFDLIISISAIQWLLAEKIEKKRRQNLIHLAKQCGLILRTGGKMVVQFYPKSDSAMKEIGGIFADFGGFIGTFIIDNPDNPKKRKVFMYLERSSM